MAPKKAKTEAAPKRAAPSHPTYKDMITDAILQLKERKGSSRQALKKYIQQNYKITAPNFESLFNTALRRGVTNGDFVQPKGPSGTVKLMKKEDKKPAVPKATATKVAEKKAATAKKATTATKKAAPAKRAVKKESAADTTTTKKAAATTKRAAVTKKAPAKKAAAPKKAATTSSRRAARK
ncbi:hypothetical protein TRVA0_020S01860 [Trichomonascus vanleenenianus]|uniref:histone H1 n=1 Tax=Trichomonascus vanleenenianus TaxID=2268995 RepID=UPI003ECA92D0